jgi:formylmethanofuran dehydrogenase subunit D
MKLQGSPGKVYKGKEYMKHWVVIANKDVEALGWEKGDELIPEIKNGELVIKKKE